MPLDILGRWRAISPLPFGPWIFSRLVGRMVPYSGSIGARVITLEPGHAILTLRDRRRVRNHLGSVHAIALANLGELTSGLAMLTAAGPDVRGIVTDLAITFEKKARGNLRAESVVHSPSVTTSIETEVVAMIRDASEEVVAIVTVTWRLAPVASP